MYVTVIGEWRIDFDVTVYFWEINSYVIGSFKPYFSFIILEKGKKGLVQVISFSFSFYLFSQTYREVILLPFPVLISGMSLVYVFIFTRMNLTLSHLYMVLVEEI